MRPSGSGRPVYRSADAQEGPAAFRDKRAPGLDGKMSTSKHELVAALADDLAAESAELRAVLGPA